MIFAAWEGVICVASVVETYVFCKVVETHDAWEVIGIYDVLWVMGIYGVEVMVIYVQDKETYAEEEI